MARYYGIEVGDRVDCRGLIGTVERLDPMDNNRVYVRMDNGKTFPCVAEWCEKVSI